MEKKKYAIRWSTTDTEKIEKIRERFNIPSYKTINGWSPAEIDEADDALFRETSRRRYFQILPYTWELTSGVYSFIPSYRRVSRRRDCLETRFSQARATKPHKPVDYESDKQTSAL